MSLTSTKQNNPCPICQDTSGDCRLGQNDLVLCHSYIEQDSGIAGWKWIKSSSNHVWGIHVPDSDKEFNREQYQRYQEQIKTQKQNRQQFLAARALDADGRDRAIRKLAAKVGLSARDHQSLLNRGLTEAQIKSGLFFSVDRWKQFNLDLPENLPGVQGNRFTTRDDGFACPAFDKHGKALGWQLRIVEATKGNKYKWAKGTFSSHLPNGELPLTILDGRPPSKISPQESHAIVHPSENASKTLYLSEGILKPYIASQRHNIAVCGSAGGYFRGSLQQLTEIISDYEELVIVPDAGDVLNSHVMRRWSQQINFLKGFNKPIKVLWWGQVSKDEHQDLDEINSETFSQAKYLSPAEFYKLAKKERYIQQQWENWRNYKKFTPQIKIEQKFVEYDLPPQDTITFIKSGLGTGKTTQTIKHLLQLQKYGIIGLGYRNTLLLQFNEKAKEVGFYHFQSDKKLREFSLDDPGVKVTNCVDSLIHYVKEQFEQKIVIIDEIISVLKHLLFSTTIKQFGKVKELFTEMVNRCNRLICLDGFMQDWAVKFFKELCPNKQIITIENTYQSGKAQVYLLEGTIDLDEKLRANDKTPWLQKLLNNDCPVICSDSQIFCEAMENLLLEQGRKGIRVDSKTVSQKHVQEFFTNPDRYIQENCPEYLIYSPSAESGLDVPTKNYFTEQFAFFFGQLDADSMIQMLGRIRDINVPKYVWAKKFIIPEDTKRHPSNLESIQADRARALMSELNSVIANTPNLSKEEISSRIQQIYQNNLDPYTTAADTITAIRNHEFSNYRECLKRQLIDSGYPVEALTLKRLGNAKEIATQDKEAKRDVKQQNSTDIYNSSERYIGQEQVNLNFDTNWSTRCAVAKAKLISRLPGINRHPVWSPDFIKLVKYDQPNLIKQTELYYLLNNPDLAKQLSLEKYNGIFNRGHIAAPWKLRQDYLKIKTLKDVGIHDFIQKRIPRPELPFQKDSPEIIAILDRCRERKNRNVLGAPGKDSIKFLHKLLRSVGVEIKSKKVKQDGKTVSVYYLDQKHLLSEERLAILQAIQLKYELKINSKTQPLEWVTDGQNQLQNSPSNNPTSEIAETTVNNELKSVAFSPQIYINNSTKCNQQNDHQSLGNLFSQTSMTNKIQNSLDTEESIADLAWMLDRVENSEDLAALQAVPEFTHNRLNLAARRLSPEQQQRLRRWAIENKQRRSTA